MLRWTVLISGVLLVSVVSLASAQERRGPGRGGPGGPGFGGPGGAGGMQGSISMLLGMAEVQKELGLSDEQKKQVADLSRELREQMQSSMGNFNFQQMQDLSPEERDKRIAEARKKSEAVNEQAVAKVAKILDAKQFQRFEQLRVQREGISTLSRPEVAAKLGLSEDQQAKIRAIQESARPQARGGPNQSEEDRRASFTRMQQQREKMQADILGVLTDAQKSKWEELKGKKFTFPQGGGGGGFGRGGSGSGGPGGGGFGGGGERVRPPVKKRDQ